MTNDSPLGIFDSGIGGLTVLKELIGKLPSEDIIYLGDTARLPYGDKSAETIIKYSLQNASFLQAHRIKMLVIACNTASAFAVQLLREKLPFSVIDVIEPAVRKAVAVTQSKRIAILGTRATICSGVYEKKILEILPEAEVFSLACPLFVPLVEEEFLFHPATELIIKKYLAPLHSKKIDSVILGCTHYPLMLPLFEKEFGERVTIIDSATACANYVVGELKKQKLKRAASSEGKKTYFASDDKEKFRRLGQSFLGIPIEEVNFYEVN